MRKFVSNFISFVPFCLLLYVGLLCLYGKCAPKEWKSNLRYEVGWWGFIFTRMEAVKKVEDVDILFLGSSHTYRGFDTRIFDRHGLKTFNLGTSAQTPMQTKVLLNRYLKQLNPKKIIFEVSPILFSYEPLEASLDLIANDENDIHSIKMAQEVNHIKLYNSTLYGFVNDYFDWNAGFKEKPKRAADTYIKGGYVEKELKRFHKFKHPKKEVLMQPEQIRAFEDCLNLIDEDDAMLYLVQAPITNSMYDSHLNNHAFDSMMIGYGNYINCNEFVVLDDSLHFYDAHHLNQEGVEIFNTVLIDSLEL